MAGIDYRAEYPVKRFTYIDLQWFAAEDEGKTEDPTEQKLRKLREEGRVPKSQELNGSVVFLFIAVALVFIAPWIYRRITSMMIYFFRNVTQEKVNDYRFFYLFIVTVLPVVGILSSIGMIAGIVINLVQNKGMIFTTKPLKPNFQALVPNVGKYFKQHFASMLGLFNIVKSLLKVAVLAAVAFVFIRSDLNTTLDFLRVGGPYLAMSAVARMVAKLLIASAVFLLVISIFDYVMQRREFKEQNKMSKYDIKQEFKESEGDPEVKGRLESAQKEMMQQNMPKAVREADVVVANPTHYAVALKWKRDEHPLPMVTAKGTDNTALTMRRIAEEHDVPVVENRPLARDLYANTQVGDIIPESYLMAVAAVYTHTKFLDREAAMKAKAGK